MLAAASNRIPSPFLPSQAAAGPAPPCPPAARAMGPSTASSPTRLRLPPGPRRRMLPACRAVPPPPALPRRGGGGRVLLRARPHRSGLPRGRPTVLPSPPVLRLRRRAPVALAHRGRRREDGLAQFLLRCASKWSLTTGRYPPPRHSIGGLLC
ncbi:hypothetical protein GQ55_9G354900 [Panicum hallii var. hallii]|uniref:Uncharacterized protein n=1 Tax=Panicum hallii var. hallii TaxID=1504633 RepID=A0A2T7C8L9_9POAL|nr:hypothetical protein GQ55_9G354900 [Panicum hallii var. hallii]